MATTPLPCKCGIPDWRALREALGMTKGQLGDLLCMTKRSVRRMENSPDHRCPPASSVMLLRTWLRHPDLRERLVKAGYPHPWPEDV